MSDGEKKRILFVDDEPNILQGLKDTLRKHRKKWDMTFEQFPRKAMELIDTENFDVIVSDMRMPEIDGAKLLTYVREKHPAAVRIILSGFTELEVAIRAVSVAHQFLTKPCDAKVLDDVVERACTVQQLLQTSDLRDLVGGMDTLPPTPQVFGEVTEIMSNPAATAGAVAKVIEQDPAMSAKLLQMSNSGFFRLARPISKVEDAIVYLGYNMIKNLVLSTEVFSRTLKGKKKRDALREIQEHSRLAAHIAMHIAPDKRTREDAFLAALLHDIGKIVLAAEHKEYPWNIDEIVTSSGCTYQDAERQLYGVSHAEVGAYLLGLWGVPFNVVEAVAYHHKADALIETLDVPSVVALSDALAHEAQRKLSPSVALGPQELAERLGQMEHLDGWRAHAANAVELATA